MGALDALAILGSGIARGYRGSQELERQLREAKRRALMEQKDQESLLGLRAEQRLASQEARFASVDERDRARRLETLSNEPIEGGPIEGEFGGRRFPIAKTRGELRGITEPLIRGKFGVEEAGVRETGLSNRASAERQFLLDNPDFVTPTRRKALGGKDTMGELVKHIFTLGDFEKMSPEKASAAFDLRLKFLETNKDRLRALFNSAEENPAEDYPEDDVDSDSLNTLTPYERYLRIRERRSGVR